MTSPAARRLPNQTTIVRGHQPLQQPSKGVQPQPSQPAKTTKKPTASTQNPKEQTLVLTAIQAQLSRPPKTAGNQAEKSATVPTERLTAGQKAAGQKAGHKNPKINHKSHSHSNAAEELRLQEEKELEAKEKEEKDALKASESSKKAVAAH